MALLEPWYPNLGFCNGLNISDYLEVTEEIPFEIDASQFFTDSVDIDASFYGSVDESITVQSPIIGLSRQFKGST